MSHFSRLPSAVRINAPFLVPTSTRTPLIEFFLQCVDCFFVRSVLAFSRTTIGPSRSGQVRKEKQNGRYFKEF
jgi:hypothetical protein